MKLPGLGTVSGFGGKRDDSETFYSFTSFTTPGTIYRYDVMTGQSSVFREPKVEFDPKSTRREQVFYTSKDGTQVPMFIVGKKGLKLDGTNPTLLYGYGGFNISLTPGFSRRHDLPGWRWAASTRWPNLRGGGEYGEDWHQAGTQAQEAERLRRLHRRGRVADRRTSTRRREKLAIRGGSNGGLLVGACMTQRPDLFGAALPAVGVMDMLRFHKFTIGWAWVDDYGSSDNAGAVQGAARVLAAAQPQAGHEYPADADHHADTTTASCRRTASSSPRRCRRPRRATTRC